MRLAIVATLAGAMCMFCACGVGALGVHADALSASKTALEHSATIIDDACSIERSREMGRAGASEAEHELHLARCQGAAASQRLAVSAWIGWADIALRVARDERVTVLDAIAFARDLARAYQRVSELLTALGVRAPDLDLTPIFEGESQ